VLQALDERFCCGRLAKNGDFAGRGLAGFTLRCGFGGAFAVVVKTTPTLATVEARINQFLLQQGRQEALVVVESAPDGIGHGEIDVVADHVHQLERPHAETAGFAHHRIDRGVVGGAFLGQAQGLGVIGASDAIDDETGGRFGVHWRLAPGCCRGEQGVGDGLVGGQAGDNLDQRHQRGRVEEVQAGQAFRTL